LDPYVMAFCCLPIALLLCYVPIFFRVYALKQISVAPDNVQPREVLEKAGATTQSEPDKQWLDQAKRANAAHNNHLENFPFFVIGVVAALFAAVDAKTVDALSLTYVCVRLVYTPTYVLTVQPRLSTIRSLLWVAGFACCLALLCLAADTWRKNH